MAIPDIPLDLVNLAKTRAILKALRDSIVAATGIQVDGSTPFTGDQSMGGHKLRDVADPVLNDDVATKNYVDNSNPTYIKKDGSVAFTADESMGGHKLTSLAAPTAGTDAAHKTYVDGLDAGNTKRDGSVAFTADESMGGHKLTNVAAPVSGGDATNKTYVDGLDINNTKKDGSVAFTGDQSMGGHKLTSVATPVSGGDATNKTYVDAVSAGILQGGRIERTTATVVTLQPYVGDSMTVNGEAVTLPKTLDNTTDNRIDSTGANAGGLMAAATLYYVYLSNSLASYAPTSLRASTTPPNSSLYLGGSGNATNWRFVGWVRTNGSTQFEDNSTNRLVANYYNRVKRPLLANPGYVNDNANTTYALSSAVWAALNGGTGSRVSFIANGEDSVTIGHIVSAQLEFDGASAPVAYFAVGIDTTTSPDRATRVDNQVSGGSSGSSHGHSVSATYDVSFGLAGYHAADLLGVKEGNSTILVYADFKRLGAAADPIGSRLEGAVWV